MKKRYIYIVTRMCEDEEFGRAHPNFGVHTSEKRAVTHFNLILDDRKAHGCTINWSQTYTPTGMIEPYFVIRQAYISRRYMIRTEAGCKEKVEQEYLQIERWTISSAR